MSEITEKITSMEDLIEKLIRALKRLIQLYTDKSHFIYELLQNAEDAEATQIKFIQYEDRLEVLHDGKPFTSENLRGLCDIGISDKIKNFNQIGEFGIGFKSVFNICETVELFSYPDNYRYEAPDAKSEFAIKINNFIFPEDIQSVKLDKPYTTKFIFPYAVGKSFSGFSTLPELKEKISTSLKQLSPTTLLFMKHLDLISYEILLDSVKTAGEYLLCKTEKSEHNKLNYELVEALGRKVANSNDIKEKTSLYLKFSRRIGDTPRTVDIAFPVRKGPQNEFICLRPASPYISVYFPTETESKLNFIVQGPYRTTPNRSSIPADHKDNISLAKETAELLADALKELKNRRILNMSFIYALPLSESSFDHYNLFRPLYDKVKDLLSSDALSYIPTNSGDYISARYAVIAQNEKLLKLFDDALLTKLIGKGDDQDRWLPFLYWKSQVYKYFTSDLKISVIGTDNLKDYFNANRVFLKDRSVDWLVELYNFLGERPSAFDKRSNNNYLTTDIILTKEGEIIAPYKKTDNGQLVPNVFLPINDIGIDTADIEFVNEKVYQQCRYFFDDVLRLQQPDTFKLYVSSIKSRYSPNFTSSEALHIEDIKFLLRNRYQHENVIQELIQNTFLIRCKDGQYRKASAKTIYLPKYGGINIEEYLLNAATDVHFADVNFYSKHGIEVKELISLGVRCSLLKNEDITTDYYPVPSGKQPRWTASRDFLWKLTLAYIDEVLLYISNNPTADDSRSKSQTIFTLLLSNESSLRGDLLIGGNTPNKKNEFCDVVKLLRRKGSLAGWNGKWLYSESGELVAPREVTKEEICKSLYGEVRQNSHIYEFLGFKDSDTKPQDEGQKEYIFVEVLRKRYGLTPAGLLELKNKDKGREGVGTGISNPSPTDFPSVRIRNWDALKLHVAEVFRSSAPKDYEYKTRRLLTSYQPKVAQEYVKSLYQRPDLKPVYACQLCHQYKPSIHAIEIFKNISLELSPMRLCLCPSCAQEYKRVRNTDYYAMDRFKADIINTDDKKFEQYEPVKFNIENKLNIKDKQGSFQLWFAQTHIAEIKELLKLLKLKDYP